MKKLIIILVVIFFVTEMSAQFNPERRMPRNKRIQKFEQMKLVEALDLDEETSVRFFARKNKHIDHQEQIFKKIDEIHDEVLKKLDAGEKIDYPKTKELLFTLEEEAHQNRFEFINSLSDILTQEQILKMIVFEKKFKEEVTRYMMQHRRGAPDSKE